MSTYLETLERWHQLKATIKSLQEQEKALRIGLFDGSFKKPVEGVNKMTLPDGRELKGTHKINRKVDQGAVPKIPAGLRGRVFQIKYSLIMSVYKKLSPTERNKVDHALEIKPGTPTLDLKDAKPACRPLHRIWTKPYRPEFPHQEISRRNRFSSA